MVADLGNNCSIFLSDTNKKAYFSNLITDFFRTEQYEIFRNEIFRIVIYFIYCTLSLRTSNYRYYIVYFGLKYILQTKPNIPQTGELQVYVTVTEGATRVFTKVVR